MRWVSGSVVALALLAALGAADPAGAAYPGANGRIAFVRLGLNWDANYTGLGDIYTVRPDGSGLQRLTFTATTTSAGLNADPVWSPNGQKIAYSGTEAGSSDIWVMNADGSHRHRITFSSRWEETCPTWSPNGRWIAFSSNRGWTSAAYRTAIFKMRSTRPWGAPIRLTHPSVGNQDYGEVDDLDAAWSPLGGRIMFTRAVNVNGTTPSSMYLATVPSGGGAVVGANTNIGGDTWGGDWAPNGRAFAWTTDIDWSSETGATVNDIWMRTAQGTLRRLTPAQQDVSDGGLAWSPDGTRIVYNHFIFGHEDSIWTIRPDGTGAHRVVGDASQPTWQPIIR